MCDIDVYTASNDVVKKHYKLTCVNDTVAKCCFYVLLYTVYSALLFYNHRPAINMDIDIILYMII